MMTTLYELHTAKLDSHPNNKITSWQPNYVHFTFIVVTLDIFNQKSIILAENNA